MSTPTPTPTPLSSNSSTASSSNLSLGQKLGRALISEIEFPYPFDKNDNYRRTAAGQLCDTVPTRDQLRFQQRTTVNPHISDAPKVALASAIGDNANESNIKSLFCMVHGEFVNVSGVDVEHGMPFDEMRAKQELFLKYLRDLDKKRKKGDKNAEQALSDFLNYSEGDAQVFEFFRRDTDGIIKGSNYFYKMCYNNLSNLWLICHACNIQKSSGDPLEWFESKKYFGPKFVETVGAVGDITPGIIFNQIGGNPIDEITQFPLGENGENGENCRVYSGGIGIGMAPRDWFMQEHGRVYEASKSHYTNNFGVLKRGLEEIHELRDQGHDNEADRRTVNLFKSLNLSNALMQVTFGKHSSDSDSDSEKQKVKKAKATQKYAIELDIKAHNLKNLKNFITDTYKEQHKNIAGFDVKEFDEEVNHFFDAIEDKAYQDSVMGEDILKLRRDVTQLLKEKIRTGHALPDVSGLQSMIGKDILTTEERIAKEQKQTAMERQEKLMAQQQTLRETQEKLVAQRQAAMEAQEKEEWKRKYEEMLVKQQQMEAAKAEKVGPQSEISASAMPSFISDFPSNAASSSLIAQLQHAQSDYRVQRINSSSSSVPSLTPQRDTETHIHKTSNNDNMQAEEHEMDLIDSSSVVDDEPDVAHHEGVDNEGRTTKKAKTKK